MTKEIQLHVPVKVDSFTRRDFDIFHVNVDDNTLDAEFDTLERSDITKLLRTEHMNFEERFHLEKLCKKFSDIFHKPKQKLNFTNRVKYQIKTNDEIPVHIKSYRYPFIHKPEIERQINEILDQGIIRPSDSPWSSPIYSKKADASGKQKWRIVVDYKKVNEMTK